MLIAKTPLRISFFGGGSDLPAFMEKETGAALSATINLFNYVIFNRTKQPIRFIHEDVQFGLANMRNQIVKEALLEYKVLSGLDIVSMSDIHAVGTGLGGSSAFTVGLVKGLDALDFNKDLLQWDIQNLTPEQLAQKACNIEIDCCKYPIGIQDQYAASYGGFRLYTFLNKPIRRGIVDRTIDHVQFLSTLNSRLVLIYSGITRNDNAGTILQRQQSTMRDDPGKFQLMKRIRDRAYQASELLNFNYLPKLDQFGELLHENWMDKKSLTGDLSNPEFDVMYEFALKNGAIGGKLLGAGGGGFFLFYVPNSDLRQPLIDIITQKFPKSKHYNFRFYSQGSTIVRV